MSKQSVPLTLLARTARSLKQRPSIASSSAAANKAAGPTCVVEKAASKSFNSSSRAEQLDQQQSYASVVGSGSSASSGSASSSSGLEWPLSSSTATSSSSTSTGFIAPTSLHARPSWSNASTLPPSIAFLPAFWTSSTASQSSSTSSSSSQANVPAYFNTPTGTSHIHAPQQGSPFGKLIVPGSASSGPPQANSGSSASADGVHTAVGHSSDLNHPWTRHAQLDQSHLVLQSGAYGIPKRAKRPADAKGKGKAVQLDDGAEDPLQAQIQDLQTALLSVQVGEDAYFVRHNSLGVADGVGGWAGRKGADPGLFAARLMHHCSAELGQIDEIEVSPGSPQLSFIASSSANSSQTSLSGLPDLANLSTSSNDDAAAKASTASPAKLGQSIANSVEGDPIEVLHRAWDSTLTEFYDLELIGSTTALIAMLRNDELQLANLGDCCCSIIRGNDYIFRSQEQQHAFNYPFQVGTNSQDTPRKDGQKFTIKVQRDDVVILSSDGLVDNLFDEDILEEVLRHGGNPQLLSQALCSRAKAVSEDQRAVASPFQQRANEEGIHFVGGKHDDISVLVAVIGDSEQQAANM